MGSDYNLRLKRQTTPSSATTTSRDAYKQIFLAMSNVEQSTNVSAPTQDANPTDAPQTTAVEDKGKGKIIKNDDAMDEDDDDDEDEEEDDDDGEEEDDDEMEGEEDLQEIDPAAILPQGRRTRGVKVDYTSAEALKKAGLENGASAKADEDDEDSDAMV
ncbi:hypothetical protein K439DRAFT_579997 [Ramaria rubella]|nr:hypothetical protein K439DRAFT_579997 [Ramaria rubella]